MKIIILLNRIIRIIKGKKSIYCKYGNKNHFSEGVIAYEAARIGDYNYFAPYTIVNNAVIKNYCSIGPGCKIGLGEHDMTAISMRPIIANGEGNMRLFDSAHPTIIGNDVWLGANVIVKQGIEIGNGAVIGANSLVLEDVPAFSIAYGSPAKVKRVRFEKDLIERIEETKWYDHKPRDAKHIVKTINMERTR